MAMIPRKVYLAVEDRLYMQRTALADAQARLRRAKSRRHDLPSPKRPSRPKQEHPPATPLPLPPGQEKRPRVRRRKAPVSTANPVEAAAIAVLEAEEAVRDALAWKDVIERVNTIFEGKPEFAVAFEIYHEGTKQCEVANRLGLDRQSVRRYRDAYICHCALLATERGLIRITEGGEDDGD